MVFTVLANIVLCPFSHTLVINNTSSYVFVQDVSLFIDAHVRDRSHDIVALEQLLKSDDRAIASFEQK